MLLSPLLKSTVQDQKDPVVIVAEDRSKSITSVLENDTLAKYLDDIKELKENIGEKYEVISLAFGDQTSSNVSDSFDYEITNLSKSLQYIYDNYNDQNIGAVVIASDGIYNEGKNPLYQNVNFNAPLHTIAIGDTSTRKDITIKNLVYNRVSYLGDKFPVQVDISAFQSMGRSKIRVRKHGEGTSKIVYESNLIIDRANYFSTHDILLNADESGVVRYSVGITPMDGEENTSNNYKNLYVEILDTKQKVLILADGPHPDVAALKNLIEINKNYEVESQYMDKPDINTSLYDLVIFHNLPSIKNDIGNIVNTLNDGKKPRLFIAGTQVVGNKINGLQDIVDYQGSLQENEEVEAIPNSFALFTINENYLKNISSFGPLTSSFGKFEEKPTANVFLYQKIQKIETKYPLLAFNDINGIKTGIFCAEGIWKWRLQDFVRNKNFETTSDLINKTIQYLTIKEDRRKFRVNLPSNVFKENEEIVFDAQIYNNSYQLDNSSDVLLVLKDESGKEYNYSFSKYNNYYKVNVGQYPEGRYRYTATTNFNGEAMVVNGRFSVESIQLEQFDLTARFDVLRSLSNKFNGNSYLSSEIAKVGSDIVQNENIKPIVYESSSTKAIIHNKWLFFLMFILLGLEWFFRRYYGSY